MYQILFIFLQFFSPALKKIRRQFLCIANIADTCQHNWRDFKVLWNERLSQTSARGSRSAPTGQICLQKLAWVLTICRSSGDTVSQGFNKWERERNCVFQWPGSTHTSLFGLWIESRLLRCREIVPALLFWHWPSLSLSNVKSRLPRKRPADIWALLIKLLEQQRSLPQSKHTGESAQKGVTTLDWSWQRENNSNANKALPV